MERTEHGGRRPARYPRHVRRFNLHTAEFEYDSSDPDGYRAGMARFGPQIGASMLGGSIYDLPPGQSNCPYHYEYGNEEWLIVLEGRLTLRQIDGEVELDPGDVVCFPVGPDGAHKLTNRSDAVVRVLMLSTMHEPSVAVYPDSDKIGVWPGDNRDHLLVRRESRVDYWDGETGVPER
jgi:uncharacterized cupin superfamily protein